jgi:hypothetical protein
MDFSITDKQKKLQKAAREYSLNWLLPTVHKDDDLGITPVHVIVEAWKAGLMNFGDYN